MNGRVPAKPSWCRECARDGVPCEDHRGPNGEPCNYTGSDVYKPSTWVLEVVGQRYRGFDGVYLCTGYDPREGFWMDRVDGGRRTNVSERAIGRTFHRIDLIPNGGAERLIRMVLRLGRLPSTEEAGTEAIDLQYALLRLQDCGLADDNGLTDAGRAWFGGAS